jgi:hypothetical protein
MEMHLKLFVSIAPPYICTPDAGFIPPICPDRWTLCFDLLIIAFNFVSLNLVIHKENLS